MGLLEQTIQAIQPLDQEMMEKVQGRLDILTKPQGSLGVLEDLARQLAGITGQPFPRVDNKVVIVMAGDHGVVEEGVSAFPQEVTAQMVLNFINGGAGINVLAKHVGARVTVVNIGVAAPVDHPEVVSRKVKPGTANLAKGPAMTREEAVAALEAGIEVAAGEINQGANLLATGEMGIGNTTPSSAILAVYSGLKPHQITGRGTGVDDKGLEAKNRAISSALEINRPDTGDALDVLAKVGGLEIAGLAGCIIGAAAHRVPIVIDGFISSAAALIAYRLAPGTKDYMIASHCSVEPGHKLMLEQIGLRPMLHLEMRLGEGTGAALGMNIVEAATKILAEMATFEGAGVSKAGNQC